MLNSILYAAVTFLAGVGVAAGNYFLTSYAARKKTKYMPAFFAVRQITDILFLFLIYVIAGKNNEYLVPLLVGGALGVTLPMIFFTKKLVEKNDKKEDESNG